MPQTYDLIIFGLVAKALSNAAREKDQNKRAKRVREAIALLQTLLSEDQAEMSTAASMEV